MSITSISRSFSDAAWFCSTVRNGAFMLCWSRFLHGYRAGACVLSLTLFLAYAADAACAASPVTILKTPNGGIQPQAVVDARGTLHLIYFKGEAAAGDLFYIRRDAGQERFSDPLRSSTAPG